MLELPVYNMEGQQTGSVQIDPQILGDRVRPQLLKQAIVTYQANRRQGSARTRNRGRVSGSTRKIYRQKGTGNARMGTVRSPIRRGGGVTFAKQNLVFDRTLPKKMRRLARNNAILAKILSQDALVVEGLAFEEPKTKRMGELLRGVGASRGCLLALHQPDDNVVLSGRNLPKTDVRLVQDLNAYEILRRKKLILSRPAFEVLTNDPVTLRSGRGADRV
ncbi:MAG TPA: 50S ribosomal protein L4 [Phycisphaerae bacterium]|nr:50S ribosomal protein L4 [Phycisphaerae bacterium]